MILFLKGKGEYRTIGLLEVIWNMITTIINNRLGMDIYIHDALYRFIQGRGKVTDTLGAKLAQQLAGIFHEPLFHIFLELREIYDSLEKTRCM